MSREEHLRELVRQGQALRQEDIDLGAKQEQERIIKLLEDATFHQGKTHSANLSCSVCDLIGQIRGGKDA